jgi:hypothetical protein
LTWFFNEQILLSSEMESVNGPVKPTALVKGEDPEAMATWSEEEHQRALFRWAKKEIDAGREELLLLGAVPNGMRMLRWNALKGYGDLGFRLGMPDIYFLLPRGRRHGLFIELKSKKAAAKASPAQSRMMGLLERHGYDVRICRGCDEAIASINEYGRLADCYE